MSHDNVTKGTFSYIGDDERNIPFTLEFKKKVKIASKQLLKITKRSFYRRKERGGVTKFSIISSKLNM